MKKQLSYSFLGVVFLSLLFFGSQNLFGPVKSSDNYTILDAQGNPSEDLVALLKISGLNHDGSLQSIVSITQKLLKTIRPDTKERWEIDQKIEQELEHNRKEKIVLLSQLGLLQKRVPAGDYYDYCIFLSGILERVCKRVTYMLELYNAGVRFDSLVVLAGERPLMQEENETVFLTMLDNVIPRRKDFQLRTEFPKNEADMIEYVFDAIEMPIELRSKIIFVRSPMKINKEGVLIRPTTGDTVAEWLALNPKKGSILAISVQPYCLYQHSVLKTYLPGFNIETVGQAVKEDLSIALYMDTLARILYQENIRLNIK
jgi:hypothetical protein